MNQGALAQIDHALASSAGGGGAGERERLVRRTRVRRGEGAVVGRPAVAAGEVKDGEEVALEGDKDKAKATGKEVDDECFDDSDYYQQLLRDVVESRMLDLGAFGSLSPSHTPSPLVSPLSLVDHADGVVVVSSQHVTAGTRAIQN